MSQTARLRANSDATPDANVVHPGRVLDGYAVATYSESITIGGKALVALTRMTDKHQVWFHHVVFITKPNDVYGGCSCGEEYGVARDEETHRAIHQDHLLTHIAVWHADQVLQSRRAVQPRTPSQPEQFSDLDRRAAAIRAAHPLTARLAAVASRS